MILDWLKRLALYTTLFRGSDDLDRPTWFPCKHDWYHETYNKVKHTCDKCGEHQWVLETWYPSIGEAQYNWRTMHYDDKKFAKD